MRTRSIRGGRKVLVSLLWFGGSFSLFVLWTGV